MEQTARRALDRSHLADEIIGGGEQFATLDEQQLPGGREPDTA